MRIIMIGQKGWPLHGGGIERHVGDLAMRLTQQGHDVVVYARKGYRECQSIPNGVRIIPIPTIHTKNCATPLQSLLASLHALTQKADIIHYHGIGPSLFCWIPRLALRRTRIIATFHCQDYFHQKWCVLARSVFHIGEWMACRVAHQTIAVSQTIASYVRNTYGREAAYIPNAVELPQATAQNTLKIFGLEKKNYMLVVARLVRHKGVHRIIDAYNKLSAVRALPKLVIVGTSCFTDKYVFELHDQAKNNANIIFIGEQNGAALAQLYASAWLYITASSSEGLSYSLLEAMSHGCSILASDIPEHREALHGFGTLFSLYNPDDLIRALNVAVSDGSARHSESDSHIETIRHHYLNDAVFPRLLSLYLA